MEKISKHDEYVESAKRHVAYIDTVEKIIGVFATPEDCLKAEKNLAIKKLKNLFKYHIQMVIK